MKKYLFIFMLFANFSCNNMVFKDDIQQILNINKVKIEHSERIDVSGGIRKSYLLERYKLSSTSVDSFLNGKKVMPPNNDYGYSKKHGWCNSYLKSDSLYTKIAPITLESNWGSDELEDKLVDIRLSIERESVYWCFYYKVYGHEIESVQMYVLDTINNNMYIIDSNM